MGIKPTGNPIETFYHYTVLPCLNEIIIEKDLDLSVKTLPTAVSKKRLFRAFPSNALGGEVRKFIR